MTFCSNHFGNPETSARGAFYLFLILTFHTFMPTSHNIKIEALVVINSEYLKVQPTNGGGATGV